MSQTTNTPQYVGGELSEFGHSSPVEVPGQEDGGETLYRSLAKLPEEDQSLDKLLNRVLDQMQKLHQSGLNEAQAELAESVIYLTSKVKNKLDPLNPPPAVLTRALIDR